MFDLSYTYKFRNSSDKSLSPTLQVTEIYLPARRYLNALKSGSAEVQISDGEWRYEESVSQISFANVPSISLTASIGTNLVLDARKHGVRFRAQAKNKCFGYSVS